MLCILLLFSAQQMKDFYQLIDALIRADQQIDLFEWSVQKIVENQIAQNQIQEHTLRMVGPR